MPPLADSIGMCGIGEGISEATKIKVGRAIVLTILLYGRETWTTYQRRLKKLNHFHTSCQRKILGITWQKHIPDTEVLTQVSLSSIYTILMQSQLRWAGHVARMKNHHLSKKLIFGELSQGQHSQGGQKKHFKDTLRGITPNILEYLAQDREKWYEVVKRGAKVCEARRNAVTEKHMKFRKGTCHISLCYHHHHSLFSLS